MTRFTLFRSMFVAALLAVGCDPQPQAATRGEDEAFDLEETRALIAQQNKQFTEAHITGDVAAIDSMFTPDARSYPPGAPAATGLPAIHALTVDFLKAGIREFSEETTAFFEADFKGGTHC